MENKSDIATRSQIKRLQGDSSIKVDNDAILDNYIEVEYKDRLDAIEDKEEREKYKKKIKKEYTDGEHKSWFENQIASLKDQLKKCEDSLTNAKDAATQVVASNTIPAVVTVGSASSTPNPAYTAIDNAQKKKTLLCVLKDINTTIQGVLTTALLIHWILPQEVNNFIELYVTLSSIINAIPG